LSEKTVFRVLCVSKNGETGPHVDILRTAGFELRHVPDGVDRFVEDNLISLLDGCVACIAGAEPYTARIIAAHPQLRVIARSGVGFDAIDLDACDRAGVVVTTTPGVNHHAVAEHTIALLMGVARGFPGLDRRVRAGNWVRIPSPRVMGTTLGLVGLGRIGRAVATRAKGLGMKVLAHDPFPPLERRADGIRRLAASVGFRLAPPADVRGEPPPVRSEGVCEDEAGCGVRQHGPRQPCR
jgi:phosphoglycerate dehydrogenase-like enzyme